MMISKLELQGFKNFQAATLDLGPLTLLVGTNASGKSNLRDAFRFLHGVARGYSLAEIFGGKWAEGGYQPWIGLRGGKREAAFSGGDEFCLKVTVGCYLYEIGVAPGKNGQIPRVVKESLYVSGELIFDTHPENDIMGQHQNERILFVRLPRGGENKRNGPTIEVPSGQPVLSQLPSQHIENKTVSERVKARIHLFLGSIGSMQFLDLSPDAMRKPSMPGQDILSDRGENLSSVLQQIVGDETQKRILLHWIATLTPMDVADVEFESDATGSILLWLVEKSGVRLSANSASDGTLRFLGMLAALLGPKPAQFYFLEELENGIHPTRQYLLLDLLERVTADKHRAVQVVATSHSPQLLTFLTPENRQGASLVYRNEHRSGAGIRRIMELPDIERVLTKDTMGVLHASGWFEDMAACFGDEETNRAQKPEGGAMQ